MRTRKDMAQGFFSSSPGDSERMLFSLASFDSCLVVVRAHCLSYPPAMFVLSGEKEREREKGKEREKGRYFKPPANNQG